MGRVSFKKSIIASLLLLCAVALVVGFQNCTNVPGFTHSASQVAEGGSGNGESYGGKVGSFVYRDHASPCSQVDSDGNILPNMEIHHLGANQFVLVRDHCSDIIPQALDPREISSASDALNTFTFRGVQFTLATPKSAFDPKAPTAAGYSLSFSDEFTTQNIGAQGPIAGSTKWVAHTPNNNDDFGDAVFTEPGAPNDPFAIINGELRIRAQNSGSGWTSGIISSVDSSGNGFAQQYGYFELRGYLPSGKGTWPAFWLSSLRQVTNPLIDFGDISIVQQHGHIPDINQIIMHAINFDTKLYDTLDEKKVSIPNLTSGYHTFGMLWTREVMIFYCDGVEIHRTPTPALMHEPYFVLVDLNVGGGWSTTETPNPSDLYVDYVRIYKR